MKRINAYTFIDMKITFDHIKDATNIAKHGISLARADLFEWETALDWMDERMDYGEVCFIAIGYIGNGFMW